MKQLKPICVLTTILILLLACSGCATKVYGAEFAYRRTAYFSISLAPPSRDQDVRSRLIEEDSYGRQLVWVEGKYISVHMSMDASFYVIQQKYDRKAVYYYEDIAWCFDDTEGDDLEAWKKQNDWNTPLCDEKMSCRQSYTLVDGHVFLTVDDIPYQRCNRYISRYERETQQKVLTSWLADGDENGKELWILRIELEGGETEDRYIILTDGEGASETTLPVSEALADWRKLTQFKYENGWHYPEALIKQLLQMF